MAHTVSRAAPVTPVILQKIHSVLDLSIPYHATMWSIMIIGFLLFARIGNLLPASRRKFDKSKLITRSDVFVAEDCVIIQLSWTKTLQMAERVLQIPLYAASGSLLCPRKCLLNLVHLSPGLETDLLFVHKTSSGLQVITQSEFTKFFRKCLNVCGFDDSVFSGHSLRRGGATCAFEKGVPGELVKNHGDWRSEAYLVYLQFSSNQKLQTTKAMLS